VEGLNYPDRSEVRAVPHPRSLANLKWEILEKKWAEAHLWAGGGTYKAKYWMPKCQKLDSTIARSTKRLASRPPQLKTGHCLSVQYLNWTKDRSTPQCWWHRYPNQTGVHLLKVCPEWNTQQKILWAEVKKDVGIHGSIKGEDCELVD